MVEKKITYGLASLTAGIIMFISLLWIIFYLPPYTLYPLNMALLIFSFLCIALGGMTLWEGIAQSQLSIPTREKPTTIALATLPKLGLVKSQQSLAREIAKHRRIFLIRTIILILNLPCFILYVIFDAFTMSPEEFRFYLGYMQLPLIFIAIMMFLFLRRHLYFLKASSTYLKHATTDTTQSQFTAGILQYQQLFSQFLIERWDIPKIERSQHLIIETKTGIGFELFSWSTAGICYIGTIPLLLLKLVTTPPPLIMFNHLLMIWMLVFGLIDIVLSIQWIRMGWRLLKAFAQSDHWAEDLERTLSPQPQEGD